jgi:hypothetical protein
MRLADLAHYDALTGLANRALMTERQKRALLRAERSEHHVALLAVDLDHFKAINHTYGHDVLVPIDNSPTEREFQNVAKLRLNMLFAGSTEGAHRACVLLGIIATCRALRVPAQAYLAWAFERLGTHRDIFDLPLGVDPGRLKENPRLGQPRFPTLRIPPELLGHGATNCNTWPSARPR